jgi:hypothetical protein
VPCYRARARTRQPRRDIWKWRLLLPGASEPRLRLLRPQGFRSVFQTALRGLGNRSIVVVGNYGCGPITVEPCRAKARPLRPRRSYFAPISGIGDQRSVVRTPLTSDHRPLMVEAPGTAPGSDRFIAAAIYRHSRLAPAPTNIRPAGGRKKTGHARRGEREGGASFRPPAHSRPSDKSLGPVCRRV